ncbi:hypothetical protein L249_7883 [Ophiocordyceps polyrhachis-furcata BCC 54312]|uniref:Uncharacterized protein n=1 Tax=Ophiocordyceps polyrhachis-furcata BCC 54312 TaxID=1330021 RepID=A0A367L0S3_9HYPO|nr:hypothetical protein L249_7883 [Ophiocordyceps polyrhachis-furcata BCC 54312]
MMSNQGVDHVIEKKKTNHVMVVLSDEVKADNKLEVVLYYSTMTWLYVTPFHFNYSASIAYSAPIDVTAAFPTVTQGVVAGLRPNWYNLFQVALQAYFLSI